MKTLFYPTTLFFSFFLFNGCVTLKQFDELQSDFDEVQNENRMLALEGQDGEIELREMTGRIAVLEESQRNLSADTARIGRKMRQGEAEIARLEELNDVLNSESSSRMAAINDENRALLEDLSRSRTELQQQEDALNQLRSNLESREKELSNRLSALLNLKGCFSLETRRRKPFEANLLKLCSGLQIKGCPLSNEMEKSMSVWKPNCFFPQEVLQSTQMARRHSKIYRQSSVSNLTWKSLLKGTPILINCVRHQFPAIIGS
jgi:small-conductance mechanosensitive channel